MYSLSAVGAFQTHAQAQNHKWIWYEDGLEIYSQAWFWAKQTLKYTIL